jgi:hypothetical protein
VSTRRTEFGVSTIFFRSTCCASRDMPMPTTPAL